MIIQGSNNPLVIQFDTNISDIPTLVVSLWSNLKGLDHSPLITWNKSDMDISGSTAVCPVSESQTSGFPGTDLILEAKGLDGDGNTIFWDEYKVDLKRRRDRIIHLTQTGGG